MTYAYDSVTGVYTPSTFLGRKMEVPIAALRDSATNLANLANYCKTLPASDPSGAVGTAKQYAIDALVTMHASPAP